MNASEAIRSAGLADKLKAFAGPHTLNSEIIAWIRARPELAGKEIHFPAKFTHFRKEFGCLAKRGGVRPRGTTFYGIKGKREFNGRKSA